MVPKRRLSLLASLLLLLAACGSGGTTTEEVGEEAAGGDSPAEATTTAEGEESPAGGGETTMGETASPATTSPGGSPSVSSPVASASASEGMAAPSPTTSVTGDALDRAALVIAQGGLGDESYNDLAFQGFQRALERTGVDGQPVESDDIVAQGEQVLRRAGESDFGLIINLEFSLAEAMGQVAPNFPERQWAIVNTEVDADNVTSVLFQEQQGSYLAGALAAQMTTVSDNEKINSDKTIGVVGGTQSTGIDKFIVGYIQGAKDTDSEVEVLTSYVNDFGDPAGGQQQAEAMYEQGADIVFHVAGGSGAGVIQAAEEANRYAIGVDTNQDDLAPGNVLTSMIKRVDVAVENLVVQATNGTLEGGETLTLGLEQNGVGLSNFEFTRDEIPDDILDRVDELRQQIISGEQEVWNVIEQGYPDFYNP